MIERTISLRYARALLQIAKEANAVDDYARQLTDFCSLCQQYPDLMAALSVKGFGHVNRLNVLNAVLEKSEYADHFRNFLRLLVKKSRIHLLDTLCEQYIILADAVMGRCQMTVTSSVDLQEKQYGELLDLFGSRTGQKMVLNKKIDPSVLGGIRVQIGDRVYDNTIKYQLKNLKERMLA